MLSLHTYHFRVSEKPSLVIMPHQNVTT